MRISLACTVGFYMIATRVDDVYEVNLPPTVQRILGVFAPAGRMTLTLYVGQSLVFVPVFYGFGLGLHDDLSQIEALLFGFAAFAVQLIGARLWYRWFRYGPLEWLWRAATYTTLKVPFAKARPAA